MSEVWLMTAFSAVPAAPRGPFIGARPFEAHDEMLLFGRAEEVRKLTRTWQQRRLTILHSDAGAGKTSLLRAGVVPALKAGNAHVLPIGLTAPTRVWPVAALPDHNRYVLALLSSWHAANAHTHVPGLSIDDFLQRREEVDRQGRPAPTLAAIDQVELFLRPAGDNEHERCAFLNELLSTAAKRPRLRLLLSVRTDYLDELLRVVKGFEDLQYEEFALGPFSPEAAAEVVRRSIESSGYRPAPSRTRELLDELRTIRDAMGRPHRPVSTIDPMLLQVTGTRLWSRPPGQDHPIARMEDEVDAALTEYCSATLASIAADFELLPAAFHAWLHQTVVSGVARKLGSSERITAAVVRSLEDRHLIRAPQKYGLRMYILRHPRLMAPLRRLDPGLWPRPAPGTADRLRAAMEAAFDGEPERARSLARKAADACSPDELRAGAAIESLLGSIAYEQHRLNEAAGHYLRACELYEALRDNTAVGWLLAAAGRVALDQGRQRQATVMLRAAVERVPHDVTLQTSLGQNFWMAGEPQAALAVLNNVINREGNVPEARRTRGEMLADLGDAESALRDIGQASSRWPQPSARAARALALATLSRTEEADRELAGAVADAGDSGPVYLRAARVRMISGDSSDAARYAELAILAIHPPLPPHQHGTAKRLSEEP
ncbi:ATP-binding protein [Nonomuraea sp. NPDC059023]|uniref:nSTAND1 domain-containing NTPase n=1 Tax=unclassified Nonomuraea TaxID=2593643 RepID=UPI0036863AA1